MAIICCAAVDNLHRWYNKITTKGNNIRDVSLRTNVACDVWLTIYGTLNNNLYNDSKFTRTMIIKKIFWRRFFLHGSQWCTNTGPCMTIWIESNLYYIATYTASGHYCECRTSSKIWMLQTSNRKCNWNGNVVVSKEEKIRKHILLYLVWMWNLEISKVVEM